MADKLRPMTNVSSSANDLAGGYTIMGFPYSKAIYELLLKKNAGTDIAARLQDALKPNHLFLAMLSEARTRLTDKLVRETGVKKILELAAGFAPSGLMWTEDHDVEYVEMDLPEKSKEKAEVVQELIASDHFTSHPNLHFEGGDARSLTDLQQAIRHFGGTGPIAIIHKGLMRYLTHDEKKIMAGHFLQILRRFGGVWITPDINLPDPYLADPRFAAFLAKSPANISNTSPTLFKDFAEAQSFFESLGFEVEQRSFKEVLGKLLSAYNLKIPAEEVEQFLGWRMAFVMRPR